MSEFDSRPSLRPIGCAGEAFGSALTLQSLPKNSLNPPT